MGIRVSEKGGKMMKKTVALFIILALIPATLFAAALDKAGENEYTFSLALSEYTSVEVGVSSTKPTITITSGTDGSSTATMSDVKDVTASGFAMLVRRANLTASGGFIGSATGYVYWKIVSPKSISITLAADKAMATATEGSTNTDTVDWGANIKEASYHRDYTVSELTTETVGNAAGPAATNSGGTSGVYATAANVYTHPTTESLQTDMGFAEFGILTESLWGITADRYSANLVLKVTSV